MLVSSVLAWVLVLGGPLLAVAGSANQAEVLKEAQAAFDQKQYERTIQLVEPLAHDKTGPLDAGRLKVRSLVRLGHPTDALTEYERVEDRLGQDDSPLLR